MMTVHNFENTFNLLYCVYFTNRVKDYVSFTSYLSLTVKVTQHLYCIRNTSFRVRDFELTMEIM